MGHIIVWIRPKNILEKILTLKSHRDTHLTYNTRVMMESYLSSSLTHTIDFRTYTRTWSGTPKSQEVRDMR